MNKRFLVEIAVKHTGRHVEYREVDAADEYWARHKAIDEFCHEVRYEPAKRRRLAVNGVHYEDCCAPDAVEI